MISVPDIYSAYEMNNIVLDNIIITAGDDKNIRILNLGNDFSNQNLFMKDYGEIDCYHLANQDFLQ